MHMQAIIDKVRDHPEIWQSRHSQYNHKHIRSRFWKRVSRELATNEQILRKQWKNLQDTYRKEYLKVQKSMPTAPIRSYWIHYESLSFLEKEMTARDHRRRKKPEFEKQQYESENEDSPSPVVCKTEVAAETSPPVSIYDSDDNSPPVSNLYVKKPKTIRRKKTTTATPHTKVDLILKRLNSLTSLMQNSTPPDEPHKDEDYMFFMSILPTIRHLAPVQKLKLRGKINEWVLQALSHPQDPLKDTEEYLVPMADSKEAVMDQIMNNNELIG